MTDPVPTRRSMLTYATGGVLAVGAVGLARPLLGNWAPAADTVSGRDSLFDISGMAPDEERSLLMGWIPDHARRDLTPCLRPSRPLPRLHCNSRRIAVF